MAVTPIRSTTQEHLDIQDVRDDLILLKDGSAAMVLQISSVNFGLLSEEEQDATIYSYAALLNSLSFPIQILIRSQKKDVSGYLQLLETQEQKQTNPLLKNQIKSYRSFVEKTVKEGNVLDKKFYIIIPFSYLELGVTSVVKKSIIGKTKTATPNVSKEFIAKKALTALKPKREHLFRQFARLGLKIRQLKTEELVQLLFSSYNPDSKQSQEFSSAKNYSTPLVQAAIQTTAKVASTQSQNPSKT